MTQKIVTFGEIMLRLSPPSFRRFVQAESFDATYGGAEANVAVALAYFGVPVDYVTRLPENDLGNACLNYLRRFGVCTDNIIRGGDRLGIYFLEIGAAQREIKVIYDRANSAIAAVKPGMIEWEKVFSNAKWFHWTGITPAISEGAATVCLEGTRKAKEMGLTVSCDLNYRSQLWKWNKTPEKIMSEMMKTVDIAIGNEVAIEKFFGIEIPREYAITSKVEADRYSYIGEKLMKRFSNLQKVAITLRRKLSSSHNSWSGVLYDGGTLYTAPTYQITHIIDRVGGGDAFAAGLIYGLLNSKGNIQKALDFAVAASCLKHSIEGDSNLVTLAEVEDLAFGQGAK